MNFLDRIKSDIRGARILADWIGDGAVPVSRELAIARAAACISCPGKHNKLDHRRLEKGIAEAIREQESVRNKVALKTSLDGRLHSCLDSNGKKGCGCYLKLKVWVPIENQGDFPMPNYCWVTKEREKAGIRNEAKVLKAAEKGTIVINRQNAMGDVILAAGVAAAVRNAGFNVAIKTAPALNELFLHHPYISTVAADVQPDVDLDGVWERERNRGKIDRRQAYLWTVKNTLKTRGIELQNDVPVPVLAVSPEEKSDAEIALLTLPRPIIGINPKSNGWINRAIPEETWVKVAAQLPGTKVWLGTSKAPQGFFDPSIRTIRRLMAFISVCNRVVSPDTGPMHVALALKVPTTVVTGPFRPQIMLPPSGIDGVEWNEVYKPLRCIGCGDYVCQIDKKDVPCTKIEAEDIVRSVKEKL